MNIGLIFGMIVSIVVIGLLIVFGYDQIANMQQLQQQAELLRSIENFKAAVDRVYSLSGESSEKFTLTFPASVHKVCFLPAYRELPVSTKKGYLSRDLRSIIEDSSIKYELSTMLVSQRIGRAVGSWQEVDKNQTLLVFFKDSSIPEMHDIPHLEPSLKGQNEVLCVQPKSKVWLQRAFDDTGAWVDVEFA
jgi:hypothetical protein